MSGAATATTLQVVTANRLADGRVVFFTGGQGWSEKVAEARPADDAAAAENLLAGAQGSIAAGLVIDTYLIEVEAGDGLRPVRFRERIRAFGPPIHPEFARPGA